MSVIISKTFKRSIQNAAIQLNAENQKVYLEKPFSGFYVSFMGSEKYPSELFSFENAGIDREGEFYLICEKLMG